jgi:hypothetical protein
MRFLKLTVVAAALLAGCAWQSVEAVRDSRGPSAHDARMIVADIVRLARSEDFAGLCALGAGNCEAILEAAGRMVPPRPPVIARNEPIHDRARRLVLCGLHDDGRPYATEIVVIRRSGRLLAVEPVYWSGLRVAVADPGVGQPEPPALAVPRRCPSTPGDPARIEGAGDPVLSSTPMR